MSKMPRQIVVDASIARSAGDGVHPTSRMSREFLLGMMTICHRVVTSPDIAAEWRNHASRFTIGWLAAMQSKGKVVKVSPDSELGIRARILSCSDFQPGQVNAMEKDLLLLEAALSADRIVASSDQKVRELFAAASAQVREIANVTWVNPCDPEDRCSEWLKAGARGDEDRRLGTLGVISRPARRGGGQRSRQARL